MTDRTYRCGDGAEARGYASIVCVESDRYVVYALDPALTAAVRKDNVSRDILQIVKEVRIVEVEEDDKTLAISPRHAGRWREALREYVKTAAKGLGRDVEVVATWAKGLYGGFRYLATPQQILAALLLGLWSQVEALGEAEGELVMHLDVIHGVNFMPIVTLYVTRLLVGAALLYGYSKVKIHVYNATPTDWSYEEMYSEEIDHLQLLWKPSSPTTKALSGPLGAATTT